MQANAGDWAVRDNSGDSWSVADGIFLGSYEVVDEAKNLWRRTGVVLARPARIGETFQTLEGLTRAAPGDWAVKGTRNELWPVPSAQFALRYERVDETA